MANLTDQLPLTQGTNRVIDDPAKPSVLGAVADFAKDAIHGYAQLKQDMAQSARERAASAKAQEKNNTAYDVLHNTGTNANRVVGDGSAQQDYAAINQDLAPAPTPLVAPEVTIGKGGVGSIVYAPPSQLDPAVQRSGEQSARRINSVVAAVDQGKLPRISLPAAMQGEFQAQLERHPNNAEDVLDIWKKAGIDTNLFRAGKDAGQQLEEAQKSKYAQVEDDRQLNQTFKKAGLIAVGALAATGGANGGPMTEQELMAHGVADLKSQNDLAAAEKRVSIAGMSQTQTRQDRTQAQEDLTSMTDSTLSTRAYNQTIPIINSFQHFVKNVGDHPSANNIKEFESFRVGMGQMVSNFVEHDVALASASPNYRGDIGKLRTQQTAIYNRLLEPFTGEMTLAKSSMSALSTISTITKTQLTDALPLFSALRDAGLHPENMPEVIQGLTPEFKTQLAAEMKGFNQDFGNQRPSGHLMNIVKILRGEATLTEMSPESVNARLPQLAGASNELAKGYARGLGPGGEAFMHGHGEVAIASRRLNPASSSAALGIATVSVASPTHTQALIKLLGDKNVDRTMAEATVTASLSASVNLLDGIRPKFDKVNKDTPHFEAVWDAGNASWTISNAKQVAALRAISKSGPAPVNFAIGGLGPTMGYSPSAGSTARLRSEKPPREMTRLVEAANMNLKHITDLAPHSDSLPKVPSIDLRRWYGHGYQSNAMQALRQNDGTATNIDAEISNEAAAIRKTIDQNLTAGNTPVTRGSIGGSGKDWSQHEMAPVVSSAAQAHGVPENIAVKLIGTESSMTPGKLGPVLTKGSHKGDRAMGLGQVMDSTARAYGVTDRSALNPAQQADLAMRVLSDNFKRTGNWKDALAMYHSGKTYDKAANSSDGNMRTQDYVDSILGA